MGACEIIGQQSYTSGNFQAGQAAHGPDDVTTLKLLNNWLNGRFQVPTCLQPEVCGSNPFIGKISQSKYSSPNFLVCSSMVSNLGTI